MWKLLVMVTLALQVSCGDGDKVEKLEKQVGELEDDISKERKKRRAAERKYEDAVNEHEAEVKKLRHQLDEQKARAEAERRRPTIPARPRRVEPDPAAVYAFPIDQSIVEGPADAKVTIVFGYDYACPYCQKSQATLADLKRKYGPDLRIAYTQLLIHPASASTAAHAACAAARQGGFARLDPLLWDKGFLARKYDKDRCWVDPGGCPLISDLAREAGLDAARLVRDMASCTTAVAEQTRRWRDFSISATPAFFVNGRYVSGFKAASGFEPLIDEELAKANAKISAGTPSSEYFKRHVLGEGLTRVDPASPHLYP